MEWTSVTSLNVDEIAHEIDPDILYVRFLRGSTYQYHGVPESMFNEMATAASPGGYLNANIKNAFAYNQV